ncbi:OmpP1/FadL family transporter [Desulfogranum japonicum]|uniref:OmpP1/FadL family transporter n=1 Tax=Desulfogranum japonicum TaxID=231447 RepID=UPI00041AED79|nr:outer membrane protein transport protein [Desulfogranum japonicum]
MQKRGEMNKALAVAGVLFLTAAGTAHGSGWRIPEQSINSTARSGAYVAYTPDADATYYNPANMSWLEDTGFLEFNATWIHLSAIDYTDSRSPLYSGTSEEEDFLLPTFFAVSPYYGNFRVGFSFTAPGGLSKKWNDPYPKTYAEEFTLKIFEANPTVSYKICDYFSLGLGVRAVYADGKVSSAGMLSDGTTLSRSMEGDAWESGFNVAMTARPLENLNLAVTYRSEVDLDIDGDAQLATSMGPGAYNGGADVSIPLPAVLAVAASYTFFDQLTVELEYDRTYWSDYENLDFNYSTTLTNPVLYSAFDTPQTREWSDTDSFRISAEYDLQNGLTLMAGFAIDENPAPDEHLGFELPDSDAKLYSLGARYQVNESVEVGVAYLYDDKESRTVSNRAANGTFEDAAAHLFTVGLTWKL